MPSWELFATLASLSSHRASSSSQHGQQALQTESKELSRLAQDLDALRATLEASRLACPSATMEEQHNADLALLEKSLHCLTTRWGRVQSQINDR